MFFNIAYEQYIIETCFVSNFQCSDDIEDIEDDQPTFSEKNGNFFHIFLNC